MMTEGDFAESIIKSLVAANQTHDRSQVPSHQRAEYRQRDSFQALAVI